MECTASGTLWRNLELHTACPGDQNPKAVRAIGQANARNPIPIIIPCHRVIGKNSELTGYAGGLGRKAQLLELERRFKHGQKN